jgi:HrpA-like RNA helicase
MLPPSNLPIEDVIPQIVAELRERTRLVISAPPGAGKTTRVPLTLLDEDWRGDRRLILVEPRRIAARAAAERMAATLGEKVGQTIGIRSRLDVRVSNATRIEVVTEGVFSRMVLSDPGLDGIAAVLFDEFHERSLDADEGLAFAMDAQAVIREDLRIVLMSATLPGNLTRDFFDGPVVESLGRAWPVETRYLGYEPRERLEDQVAAAIRKALREEDGSVLAFLPGVAEIQRTVDRIGPVDGLAMAWKDKGFDDRLKVHRTALEVHVPLASLGITGDPAGRSIGFDASVAVANDGGDRRERAMHWAGLSEGVVVDRPGSAVLLPRTWGTLTFMKEQK